VEYVARVGERVVARGTTDAEGAVELFVPGGQAAELEIFGTRYEIVVRAALEDVASIAGQQRRLQLLGYYAGAVDGEIGAGTGLGLLNFQADQELNPDGVCGRSTQSKLAAEAGA